MSRGQHGRHWQQASCVVCVCVLRCSHHQQCRPPPRARQLAAHQGTSSGKDNGSVQRIVTCAEPPLHAFRTVKVSSQAFLAKESRRGSHLCMRLANKSIETVAPRRFWPRKAGRLQRGGRICVLLASESIEMVAPKRFCFIFC